MTTEVLTVLDLFCGAGGLSLGFVRAGFDVIGAVDNHAAAIETYQANLGLHVKNADLSDEIDLPEAALIIGGPPCQGFSSAGLRRSNDDRNSLVSRFAQTVAVLKPQTFVFENVEGFLTAQNGQHVMELLAPLISAGYRIHLRKINAANYGVPQHRKRVIAIGGLGWSPSFPEPTHSAFGMPGAHLAASLMTPTPSVIQALNDLPVATTILPESLQGHFYRPLEGVEFARAVSLKPGQTMRDLPNELQHQSYHRRAYRRVMDGTPSERRGGAPTGIRRLLADEPSKAITGGALSELLHPIENRYLTLRECARLQTFPDTFIFYGTHSEQCQLIGNAVPPLLAQHIAQNLLDDLRAARKMFNEGALFSFVPTLSKGLSPALKHVTQQVLERFARPSEPEQMALWD